MKKLFQILYFLDGNSGVVRYQVRTNEPPETRIAFERLKSGNWPRWRIWMVLVSAYRIETKMASKEGRAFDLARYKKLLNHVGDYPDGYDAKDATEVFNNMAVND